MKSLQKAFSVNEYGMVDFPKKVSNVKVSRILFGNKMGCSYCFPHGFETVNSTISNRQKNWKRKR